MPTLSLGSSELYYEVRGEGPALVLAHGVGGNHAAWFQQIPALSERFRVVCFDHRGFGNSTDVENAGRSRFIQDLRALLDHLAIERAALVGQSMGGGTCVGFAGLYPKRVSALILADTLRGIVEPEAIQVLMAEARAKTEGWSQLERVLGATTRRLAPDKASLYTALASFNARNRKSLTGSYEKTLTTEELTATGLPVLFIVGSEDPLFPPRAVRAVQERVDGASLVEIERAGHSAFFERPEAFNEALVDWLEGLEQRDAPPRPLHARRAPLPLKVGIAGLGTIGGAVARALDAGIEGLALEAITTRSRERAARRIADSDRPVDLVDPDELAERCDVIVECVPKAAFLEIATLVLRRGRLLVSVSGAALIEHASLVELARERGGRIVLASGAILGLDALRAAREGTLLSVTMVTRKPPRSLRGAPYLAEKGIELEELIEPRLVFEGSAREGARGFPANVNVAAAVGLAGIGLDDTRLEIWADPHVERNQHTVRVEADSARFELHIENVPSRDNPGTGRITALSVIATLRALTSPLKVGT